MGGGQGSGSAWSLRSGDGPTRLPTEIDTSKAHPARVYDYWLGGKDNFPADRELAEKYAAGYPGIRIGARENRAFLRRAVTHLIGAGVTQFLDLGTGIPTANNTHEVAQSLDPAARVVYVDNDPIVLTHARALLTGTSSGSTAYLDADIRNVETILEQARATVDFDKPVAVMSLMTIQFVPDNDEAYAVVSGFVDALPSGGYLVLSSPTGDFMPAGVPEKLMKGYEEAGTPFRFRSRDEFAAFFGGLDLVEPGVVPLAEWRAESEPQPRPTPQEASGYAAVARKP